MTQMLFATIRPLSITLLLFLLMSMMFPNLCPAAQTPQIMVILDASGSMWGQIDGASKITIARQTLDKVLNEVPSGVRMGLMAYGHREKGNCEDIETLVQPASGTADQIRQTVSKIHPKGMTPLAQTVLQAAEGLNFAEEKATVILITDGLETCKADPCALARKLEKAGIDFTTHVVGFGLNEDEGRQVACLAEETGGIYLSAGNARELGEALTITVKEDTPIAAHPAKLPKATLHAVETVEQAAQFTVDWEGPGDRFDSIQLVDPAALNGAGKVVRARQLVQGDPAAKRVTFTAPTKVGHYHLRYYDARNRAVLASIEIKIGNRSISISAPDQIPIDESIKVEWTGPRDNNDWIKLFDPKANNGDGRVIYETLLTGASIDKSSVLLPSPGKEGLFQLRYWNQDNKAVLASREITVTKRAVSISAPNQIHVGGTINIGWAGPGGKNDWIQLFDPKANIGDGKVICDIRLTSGDYDNHKVSLVAPGREGQFQLRYWNNDNKVVLTTHDIRVTH